MRDLKKMKQMQSAKKIVCFLGVFITALSMFGCEETFFQSTTPKLETVEIAPSLAITDRAGNPVGWGVALFENTIIVPDHLLQVHRELFWQQQPITILARDFESDIMGGELAFYAGPMADFASTPPLVDTFLYWGSKREKLQSTQVLGVNEPFHIPGIDEKMLSLIQLQGVIQPGDSGLPVFDDRGVVYGVLVAADKQNGVSYALRADHLRAFINENLLEKTNQYEL